VGILPRCKAAPPQMPSKPCPEDLAATEIQCFTRKKQARARVDQLRAEREEARAEEARRVEAARREAEAAKEQESRARHGRLALAAMLLSPSEVRHHLQDHKKKLKGKQTDATILADLEKELREANTHSEAMLSTTLGLRQAELDKEAAKKAAIQARIEQKRAERNKPKRWRNPMTETTISMTPPLLASFQMDVSMANTIISHSRPSSAIPAAPRAHARPSSAASVGPAQPCATGHRSSTPGLSSTPGTLVQLGGPTRQPLTGGGSLQGQSGRKPSPAQRPGSAQMPPRACGSPMAQRFVKSVIEPGRPLSAKPPTVSASPEEAAIKQVLERAADVVRLAVKRHRKPRLTMDELQALPWRRAQEGFIGWLQRQQRQGGPSASTEGGWSLMELQRSLVRYDQYLATYHPSKAPRRSASNSAASTPTTPPIAAPRRPPSLRSSEGLPPRAPNSKAAQETSSRPETHPTVLWSPGCRRPFQEWEEAPSPQQAWQKPRSAWDKQHRQMHMQMVQEAHLCNAAHVVRPEHQMVFCPLGIYPHGNHPHVRYPTLGKA